MDHDPRPALPPYELTPEVERAWIDLLQSLDRHGWTTIPSLYGAVIDLLPTEVVEGDVTWVDPWVRSVGAPFAWDLVGPRAITGDGFIRLFPRWIAGACAARATPDELATHVPRLRVVFALGGGAAVRDYLAGRR